MSFGSITWFTILCCWAVFSPRPKATVTLCPSSPSAIPREDVRPMQERIATPIIDHAGRFIGRPPSLVAALFRQQLFHPARVARAPATALQVSSTPRNRLYSDKICRDRQSGLPRDCQREVFGFFYKVTPPR